MKDGIVNPPVKRPGMVVYGYYRFPDDPPFRVRYLYRRKKRGESYG